jgi:hypothetical protein
MGKTTILCVGSMVALGAACTNGDDPVGETEPQFECASMEGTPGLMSCNDFNDGATTGWTALGGSWSVDGGRYLGAGPETVLGSECGASLMTASLRDGVALEDVGLHLEMQSVERLDKTLVLRATDPSNRIELNFRGDPINDLMVQELRDCVLVSHTVEGEIPVAHGADMIAVDVTLRGEHLTVVVDGAVVVDRTFPFPVRQGQVGVAVIENSLVRFDSIWTESL